MMEPGLPHTCLMADREWAARKAVPAGLLRPLVDAAAACLQSRLLDFAYPFHLLGQILEALIDDLLAHPPHRLADLKVYLDLLLPSFGQLLQLGRNVAGIR